MALILFRSPDLPFSEKLRLFGWSLLLLTLVIVAVGIGALYSAAGGSFDPWASCQLQRFLIVGLPILLVAAFVDLRGYMSGAYLFYVAVLLLLAAVEIMGKVGMGAKRWLDLGFIQVQPSEFMKIALVLALARFYHGVTIEDVKRPLFLIPPLLLIALPVGLVLMQPNLGTATILVLVGLAVMFAAGVPWWFFGGGAALVAGAVPLIWSMMHDYQRQRVLTFLNPEEDPRGAGYHIIQSKIALGSGGLTGKGFLQGTQSHLNFLPEKQTDFIFVTIAEEWGLVGAILVIGLYLLAVMYGILVAIRSQTQFGRLIALGLAFNLFLYIFINVAMNIGLIPVVGVPLALISWGGTSMLAALLGIGITQSVLVHRDIRLPRRAAFGED